MVSLRVQRNDGVVEVEQWYPTELPGLALAYDQDAWRLIHIRSGLQVAEHPDRHTLLERALPVIARFDMTRPANDFVGAGTRHVLIALGVYGSAERRPLSAGEDIDQHPALAPLIGGPKC